MMLVSDIISQLPGSEHTLPVNRHSLAWNSDCIWDYIEIKTAE